MNRASNLLWLAAVLPACGLFDDEKDEKKEPRPVGSYPVQPVPYEKLTALMPKMEGWESQPPRGKVSSVGKDQISVASATYEKKGDTKVSTIQLEILDGAYVSSAYSPFAVMAHSQGATDVHKIPFDVDGNPGIQDWKPETSSVTVLLFVARRFMITLKGTNISPEVVKQTLRAIPLKELASLAA